jgi:hypothetical protein
MNRNVLPLIQSVFKVSWIALLFFIFFLVQRKSLQEEFGTIEVKVVSAVDFKPMANVKSVLKPNTSIVLLTNRVSL